MIYLEITEWAGFVTTVFTLLYKQVVTNPQTNCIGFFPHQHFFFFTCYFQRVDLRMEYQEILQHISVVVRHVQHGLQSLGFDHILYGPHGSSPTKLYVENFVMIQIHICPIISCFILKQAFYLYSRNLRNCTENAFFVAFVAKNLNSSTFDLFVCSVWQGWVYIYL